MTYLDVLQHLKEFKVDRIILDTFPTSWSETGSSTVTVGTTNATVHTNALKIDGAGNGDTVYKTLTTPLNLSDRETIQLHIMSSEDIVEDGLSVILSEGQSLNPSVATINLNAIDKDIMHSINVTIPDNKLLSNIQSIGLQFNDNTTGNIVYLAAINATVADYITTKEDVESKITMGEQFVLSNLGSDYTAIPTNDVLSGAVNMAAAAYLWLKQKENEQNQFDYGYQTTTKNYGMKLLGDAAIIVEQFITGTDVGEDGTGSSIENINTDIIGGSNVFTGRF